MTAAFQPHAQRSVSMAAFPVLQSNASGDVEPVGPCEVIDRPRHLRFHFSVPPHSPRSEAIDLSIEPRPHGCELSLRRPSTPEHLERARQGWQLLLGPLARVFAQEGLNKRHVPHHLACRGKITARPPGDQDHMQRTPTTRHDPSANFSPPRPFAGKHRCHVRVTHRKHAAGPGTTAGGRPRNAA